MDKIYQAIQEVIIETADEEKVHVDSDIIDKMANRVASFLVKGVGNPNPVYDLLARAHSEGKYPASTPQGHGDNLKDYANRMMAMFMGPSMKDLKSGPVIANTPVITSHKGLSEEHTLPKLPRASDKL